MEGDRRRMASPAATETSIIKNTMTNEEMFRRRERGDTYNQIAKIAGKSADAVRAQIRRYKGQQMMDNTTQKDGGMVKTTKAAYAALADAHGYSEGELKAILSSAKGKPTKAKKQAVSKATDSVKMLVISDTHIGHEKFNYPLFDAAVEASKDCDMVIHPGDHLEGMSGRPGHIYELEHIGYNEQINACRKLYSGFDKPIYGIDGNHDQWFKQKNNAGVIVGEELERTISNYTHLGEWEGDLHLGDIWVKLFHAGDGSAYAVSYKGQKLVESFSGGEKPHIVFSGHYHKSMYMFARNVHHFESGTICGQSRFMRGKKIPAHMGFWIVTAHFNRAGITRIANEFVPGYE